jgi:hypothetical protein
VRKTETPPPENNSGIGFLELHTLCRFWGYFEDILPTNVPPVFIV